ncbi:MAG: hypothetical protein WCD69_19185, partial [Xanthobacteraceae bacterium]
DRMGRWDRTRGNKPAINPLSSRTFGKDWTIYFPNTYNAGRVAEWFKAPVLKFAFTRFVQSRRIPHDVSLSTMMGFSVLVDVGVVWVVSGCW